MALVNSNSSAFGKVEEDIEAAVSEDVLTGTNQQDKVGYRDLLFWLPHCWKLVVM